jgi:demethylmenaquinone methyltransferase/2-methoxy-6-polyprenyl-1,4-benzoquinol methylase
LKGETVSDVNYAVEMTQAMNCLRAPVLRSAIQALALPLGGSGLDAGCGTGLQAQLLAEAVGPAGHVTGLDQSPGILAHARDLAEQAGLSERITFREGDVRALPFDDDTFDWAWSVDCIGYAPMEPLPLIVELARVVRPGGNVAILAWSSEKLLPGYPRLEARLGATSAGIAPFVQGKAPGSHFSRALGWFRDAGLVDATAHTFAGDAHAPLTGDERRALAGLFAMRWPDIEAELGEGDRAAYQRLCRPESPEYLLGDPDYYAFFTYTMFYGRVAGTMGP